MQQLEQCLSLAKNMIYDRIVPMWIGVSTFNIIWLHLLINLPWRAKDNNFHAAIGSTSVDRQSLVQRGLQKASSLMSSFKTRETWGQEVKCNLVIVP